MSKELHSITIVCTAENQKALVGMIREALEEVEEGFETGEMQYSGVLQGGGPYGILQGFYNAPSDFVFGGVADGPDVPPVEFPEDKPASEPDSEEFPPEVLQFISMMKTAFPGASINVTVKEEDESSE